MTTNDMTPAPSTLAPLLLEYFSTTPNTDARDAALTAILHHLDSMPPSSTDELTLMLTACAADRNLHHAITEYLQP